MVMISTHTMAAGTQAILEVPAGHRPLAILFPTIDASATPALDISTDGVTYYPVYDNAANRVGLGDLATGGRWVTIPEMMGKIAANGKFIRLTLSAQGAQRTILLISGPDEV